ncbi:YqgQ family protein [Ornithinibacillus halophilus]|uniref:Uncharacterized protein YqgQ n=1 Tax=Ornithinibacillus halophilus TaxID=930117 RepID=A0A1M5D1Y0_9BACI|nr:YqgQ family protein [Ornithinibacillus halophilus]SHF60996.1 Uncharacterized protein YqgQ [Ornithinibacillus halophilus]
MQTVYDVRQLLKKFGTFIYVGDRIADLELMEMELAELYQMQFIQPKEYKLALLILKKEKSRVKQERGAE